MSNRVGGGVILFGFDESLSFATVGVGDVAKLQSDLSNLASDEMEPPPRIKFSVEEIEGRTVVAIEVPECPWNQKPCYYKNAGLSAGSYIRVGDGDRRMTEYEIHSYLSSRGQPRDDVEVVHEATLDDLNSELIDEYLRQLKSANPDARYLRGSREQILKRLNIIVKEAFNVHPTLAGLLMFGDYPQQFFPSLMITFVQYYGTTETEKTPRGERFLDNKKFEGTILEMVESAENFVLASMKKGALITGLYREDILEYPGEALREAIINAFAHRDYSHYAHGSQIQIRMFADRLEIQSPGGLYGPVTVENLEYEQSTRNAALMRIMVNVRSY